MHSSGDKKNSWSLTDTFKCRRGIWPAGQPAEEQTHCKVSHGTEVLEQLINKDLKLFTSSLLTLLVAGKHQEEQATEAQPGTQTPVIESFISVKKRHNGLQSLRRIEPG